MKARWKGALIGGLVGLIIWLYDHDFLLNPNGSNSHISSYIQKIIGLSELGSFNAFIFPAIVLILIGVILGILVAFMLKSKNEK